MTSRVKQTPVKQSHQSVTSDRQTGDQPECLSDLEKLAKAMARPIQSLKERIDELERRQAKPENKPDTSDGDRRITEMEKELNRLKGQSNDEKLIEELKEKMKD